MSPWVQLLYQALDTPWGIVVSHENPRSAQARFSYERKKHGDPALSRVSCTVLETEPLHVYLVTKVPDNAQP